MIVLWYKYRMVTGYSGLYIGNMTVQGVNLKPATYQLLQTFPEQSCLFGLSHVDWFQRV